MPTLLDCAAVAVDNVLNRKPSMRLKRSIPVSRVYARVARTMMGEFVGSTAGRFKSTVLYISGAREPVRDSHQHGACVHGSGTALQIPNVGTKHASTLHAHPPGAQ